MDEPRFRLLVADALKDLFRQVDTIESDEVDARLTDGVLQVDFESGGVFVLSQQVPTRELWLSAFSRAWHFRWQEGRWAERDTGEPLERVLSAHFTKRLGRPVSLVNPGPAGA
jgi:iron donor protein CyaY